ncbi:hypothetical protein GCM10027416_30280 [Okibacterium endophyticum]
MTTAPIAVEPWHNSHKGLVSASLYAVPADARPAAAEAIHRAGCRMHADLIISPAEQGGWSHSGVSPEHLREVRARVPEAHLDVHLIVVCPALPLPDELLHACETALGDLAEVRPQSIAVSEQILDAFGDRLRTLRSEGVALWLELTPAQSALTAVDRRDDIDGALVMLIPPGTTEQAHPGLLQKVAQLSPHLSTGVDGGVTPAIAARAAEAGASYIVSGRALLAIPRATDLSPSAGTPTKEEQS